MSEDTNREWPEIFKLKPEVKKLWLEALESGEYKQTRRQLKNNKGFCCLGVLTEVLMKNGLLPAHIRWAPSNRHPSGSCRLVNVHNPFESSDVLPIRAVIEAAFADPKIKSKIENAHGPAWTASSENAVWRINDDGRALYHLNDDGFEFFDIAKLIRERM